MLSHPRPLVCSKHRRSLPCHTFGTRMSAAGARPEDIQRIIGHTDYTMTANTYINQEIDSFSTAI